jgi:hydroxymethylpyrimidine/phosphomethylpyrimidine kinase
MNTKQRYFRALTIAGSDCGGGAGIQADIKTFSALGCYGMSVITALTAQDTAKVHSVFEISADFISEQLRVVLSDIGADAIKIGMLHRPEIIITVAENLKRSGIYKIVLDTVMTSKNGDRLMEDQSIGVLKDFLFPLTQVLTPNLPEASILLGRSIDSAGSMETAACDLASMGPQIVVIKGGHFGGEYSNDFIYSRMTQRGLWLNEHRIQTKNTHGTGCTFSSAITAFLAKGHEPIEAINVAKKYLTSAIIGGQNYVIGNGHGPVLHFQDLWN